MTEPTEQLKEVQIRTGNCPSCGEDWRTHDYSCKYQIIEPKPTIEELEKIREQEGNHSIDIMPNGQVRRKIHLAEQPPADCGCPGTPKIHTIECVSKPNTNAMIVKTIQGLMTCVSDNLVKLDELSAGSTKHKVLVRQALEDVDLFEKTTLYDLQRAFE